MFNSKKTKTLTMSLVAGTAAMMVSGAAYAVPYSQGDARMAPQAAPIYMEQQTTYTRSERPVPMVDSANVYDRDAATATTRQQGHAQTAEVNPNNIRFLTGGVGAEEQARFEQARSEYPVKVVFADSNGAYLSGVDVTVENQSGETVLGLKTEGPILLMDLDPGKYTIKANENGQMKSQNISVSQAPKSYTMHFKSMGPQDYSMNISE